MGGYVPIHSKYNIFMFGQSLMKKGSDYDFLVSLSSRNRRRTGKIAAFFTAVQLFTMSAFKNGLATFQGRQFSVTTGGVDNSI